MTRNRILCSLGPLGRVHWVRPARRQIGRPSNKICNVGASQRAGIPPFLPMSSSMHCARGQRATGLSAVLHKLSLRNEPARRKKYRPEPGASRAEARVLPFRAEDRAFGATTHFALALRAMSVYRPL